jgi:hypothetical protein
MAGNQEIRIEIDKQLDLLTARLKETKNPLETIESDNFLFFVDSETKDLVMIQIYDFRVIRRKLLRHLMILVTKRAIQTWIRTLADTFRASASYAQGYT